MFGKTLPGRKNHSWCLLAMSDPNGSGTGQISKKQNKRAKIWIKKDKTISDYGRKGRDRLYNFVLIFLHCEFIFTLSEVPTVIRPKWQQMICVITLKGLVPFSRPVYIDDIRKEYKKLHRLTWKEMPRGLNTDM